jgi:hypothetical protein
MMCQCTTKSKRSNRITYYDWQIIQIRGQVQRNHNRPRLLLHQRDSRANSLTKFIEFHRASTHGWTRAKELEQNRRNSDRASALELQWGLPTGRGALRTLGTSPFYLFYKNLEVEALVEATLTLFILPFTEWSRGVFIGAGGWRCGRNWCQGGTLGKPANRTHVRSATAFGQTTIVSSDSLSLGL